MGERLVQHLSEMLTWKEADRRWASGVMRIDLPLCSVLALAYPLCIAAGPRCGYHKVTQMESDDLSRRLEGVDIHRVAEVLAASASSTLRWRASGYRITSRHVMTAAHAVEGAGESILSDLDADTPTEWTTTVREWVTAGDIAILTMDELRAVREVSPSRYGRFADVAAIVEMHAIGFPKFKLKEAVDAPGRNSGNAEYRYRDIHHSVGWSAVLSNRRSGTLK